MRTRAAAALISLAGVFLLVGVAAQKWELVSLLIPLTALVLTYILIGEAPAIVLQARWEINADRVLDGDEVEAVLIIHQEGSGRGLAAVRTSLPSDLEVMEGPKAFLLPYRPGETERRRYRFRFPRRGLYQLGPLHVRTVNIIGLSSPDVEIPASQEVRVLPMVHDIERPMTSLSKKHLASGNNNSMLLGPGLEFFSLREYVTGDSIRLVNWKATARSNGVVVNQHMTQRSSDLIIVLEAGRIREERLLDQAVEMAATLCAYHLKQRDRVGLAVFGDYSRIISPGYGRRQLYRTLEVLTDVQTNKERPPFKVAQALHYYFPGDALFVLIADVEGNDIVATVQEMIGRGRRVVVVSPYLRPLKEDFSSRMREVRRADGAYNLRKLCPVEEWDGDLRSTWTAGRERS